ncbi:MAG: 7-cyano-7-deazaguanine synthase [Phycisphaerales bacterium]|nr:7-cyano-7-deazaguanine synthase [Phycisphaerales bacterium]
MPAREKAVVLLSGGMDSAVCLAIARAENCDAIALSFRYGQRHAGEIAAAQRVAASFSAADHRIVTIDLRAFGGSALTADFDVPKDLDLPAPLAPRHHDATGPNDHSTPDWPTSPPPPFRRPATEIPITYVPARNTIFLSFALALAEVADATRIYIGVNAIDYSGYPDCRPEYIAAFERLAGLATRSGVNGRPVRICAPLLHLSKVEIVQRGLSLGVDFGMTRSCYDPDSHDRACGHCDACRLRLAAFASLGLTDPAPYAG